MHSKSRDPRAQVAGGIPGPILAARSLAVALDLELEGVEAADETVDCVDDAALVDQDVVDLYRARARAARSLGHVVGDLLGAERVRDVVHAHATVEVGPEDQRLRYQVARHGPVLVQVVRAVSPAASAEFGDAGDREGRERYRVRLVTDVDDPHELRPV